MTKGRRVEWFRANKDSQQSNKRKQFDNLDFAERHEKKRLKMELDVVNYKPYTQWTKEKAMELVLLGEMKAVVSADLALPVLPSPVALASLHSSSTIVPLQCQTA